MSEAEVEAQPDATHDAVEPRQSSVPQRLLRRLLPWASLLVGVAGAVLMDRGPERAGLMAAAAIAVWVVLVLVQWLSRISRQGHELGSLRRKLVGAAHLSTLVMTQSLIQLTLFFALPFYFSAAALDAGHVAFLVGLSLLCAVSLWDPWTAWLLQRPLLAPLLPAAGSFVALTAVLPGLGLSTRVSLWLAALTTCLGTPLIAAAAAPPERRRWVAVLSLAVALCIPGALWLGAARVVPAAPLRLVKAEIGIERNGRWIAEPVEQLAEPPPRLICATAIAAPLGLRDQLFHLWRKDGRRRARVPLDIVGGRTQGYRTQSRISHFGKYAAGRYSCSVVTGTGQLLGTRHVKIGGG